MCTHPHEIEGDIANITHTHATQVGFCWSFFSLECTPGPWLPVITHLKLQRSVNKMGELTEEQG